ncbi:MAG: hypothetical protein HFJ52_02415 [Clostridia bacterium]|nr:hypothetical protein [Clostridia bacterium]
MTIINPTMQLKKKHSFSPKKYFRAKESYTILSKDVIEKIEIALAQVDAGLGRPVEELFAEMEAKYGFHG